MVDYRSGQTRSYNVTIVILSLGVSYRAPRARRGHHPRSVTGQIGVIQVRLAGAAGAAGVARSGYSGRRSH